MVPVIKRIVSNKRYEEGRIARTRDKEVKESK